MTLAPLHYMGSACPSCLSPALREEVELQPSPTEAHFLMQIAEAEARFLSLLSDSGQELVLNRDTIKVYSQDTPAGFLLRSEWFTAHSAHDFIAFLSNLEARQTWEKNQESLREVAGLGPQTGIYYKTYKGMLGMSRRDMVYVSRWKQYESGWLDISTSIVHPDFPETAEPVRMQLFLGGYFAKSIEPGKTQVICISECSFGGSIPKAIVKAASITTIPTFAKDLEAALTRHKQAA